MNPTDYAPADFLLQLGDSSATILPWIGAGVGGGIFLLLVFIGIRNGVAFFANIANERAGQNWDGVSDPIDSDWHPSNSYEAYEAGGVAGMDAYDKKLPYDYDVPYDMD